MFSDESIPWLILSGGTLLGLLLGIGTRMWLYRQQNYSAKATTYGFVVGGGVFAIAYYIMMLYAWRGGG